MADGYAFLLAFTDYDAGMHRALNQVLATPATGITARPGVRPAPAARPASAGRRSPSRSSPGPGS